MEDQHFRAVTLSSTTEVLTPILQEVPVMQSARGKELSLEGIEFIRLYVPSYLCTR